MIEISKLVVVSTLVLGGTALAEEAMPKVPHQLTDRAKATAGTWKCDGAGMGMDGKDLKFGGTFLSKTDLDGMWIHNSFSGAMGEGKSAMKYKFETYATWDSGRKQWREVFMDNFGDQTLSSGDEMKDGKLEIVGESQDALGKSAMKDHLDASDPKKLRFNGEQSKDGGKTWQRTYEMTCKK